MIRKMLLSTFTCASIGVVIAPANAEKTSYEMASYLDSPGGREIAAGDYAGAIASTSHIRWRSNSADALVAATNLCVAYTVTRAFAEAEPACGEALRRARAEDRSTYGRYRNKITTAKALLNRGVLRAVMGNSAGAATDFRDAAATWSAAGAASRNLASLESSVAALESAPANRTALIGEPRP